MVNGDNSDNASLSLYSYVHIFHLPECPMKKFSCNATIMTEAHRRFRGIEWKGLKI